MKIDKSHFALLLALTLISVTAFVLRQIDKHRQLGQPGLLMVDANVFNEDGAVVNTNTVALPLKVLDYESTNAPITKTELSWLPADTTFARKVYYRTDAHPLRLSVVMMGVDRSSIHKPQICLTGQGWHVQSEREDRIALAGRSAEELPVWKMTATQRQTMSDGSERMVSAVYVYWFVADGYVTARHGQRMWWMARELLSKGTLQRWAYVSVLSLCLPGREEQTYEQMKQFIAASVPLFHRFDEHTVFSGSND